MAQITKEAISAPRVDQAGPGVRFVLASGSPRRRDVMRLAGLDFVVQPSADSGLEEPGGEATDAVELTRANALSKLDAAVKVAGNRVPWNVVTVAADTVVSFEGAALGKPSDAEDALETLRRLRGGQHEVVTTVTATFAPHRQDGDYFAQTVRSQVAMREYSDAEITSYLASGSAFDRAGSYGVQDRPFCPTESVEGCYLNVIGMPLCALNSLLPARSWGFRSSHIYATCLAHEEAGVQ